ncbi:MAG: hypothetical protein Q9181_007325 [Wetmoreana brouardii]
MSPEQNRTVAAVTSTALEKLQSQNNTIQLVAAIFAVAYGIPLIFAVWLQWKTYVAARGHADLGKNGTDTTPILQRLIIPESKHIEMTIAAETAETHSSPGNGEPFNRQVLQGRGEDNVASKGRLGDETSGDVSSTGL